MFEFTTYAHNADNRHKDVYTVVRLNLKMKNLYLISLLFFLAVLNVRGQQRNDELDLLRYRLQSADSVILVSHEATAGISIVDTVTNSRLPLPQLLLNGKLNHKIVREKRALNSPSVEQLSNIVTRPFEDTLVSSANCFVPQHAILIYKKGKASYIDLCFSCQRFVTKDLESLGYFDQRKWKELYAFFKQNDMKYKLGSDKLPEVEK